MKVVRTLGLILVADALICWITTAGYWRFDPVSGAILFTVGIVVVGTLGFCSIEQNIHPGQKIRR
jgi:hypothetical protein